MYTVVSVGSVLPELLFFLTELEEEELLDDLFSLFVVALGGAFGLIADAFLFTVISLPLLLTIIVPDSSVL